MLSMVLLVLLLCFEPAKASLFEPAKAILLLGLCMQPAKARPPLPWWRCRVWENKYWLCRENKYWLCSPDGYDRQLDEDEEDEIEEIFDRNEDAAKYVWQQSSENLAGNCWRVSWEEPLWWYQYEPPHNAGTPDYYQHWEDWTAWQPAQGYVRRTEPAQGYGASSASSSQPAQGWPFGRPGQPRARSRAASRPRRRSSSRAPTRPATRPNEPAKAAPKKADAYQHMYRGQGAKMKREARRALEKAGVAVPDSLKPGKAVDDLPEPEKAEAKALQKRLKGLRFSSRYSASEVEWEVSQIKGRLHELLGPGSGGEEENEDEEEDELAKAAEVNKELLRAIEVAKSLTDTLQGQCNGTVKKEPEKAEQEPEVAKPVEPVEATTLEPAEANETLPTGETEESEEEEEEKGWTRVGEKKKTKRHKKKN